MAIQMQAQVQLTAQHAISPPAVEPSRFPPPPTRPRLKCKSGCLTCRKRRKKCNEQKPTCRDCSRHGLHCTWPDPIIKQTARKGVIGSGTQAPDSAPLITPDSTIYPVSRITKPPVPKLEGPKSAQEWTLFRYFTSDFLPLLLSSSAHPAYSDPSDLYANGVRCPWIMNTYIAVASLHLSPNNKQYQGLAYRYYNAAITGLRERMASEPVEGTEDWLLASTIFFYLFEEYSSTPSNNALDHVEGAAQIFRLRKKKGIQPPAMPSVTLFHRIAAESFLYHVATMSFFHTNINRLSSKFSWADIEDGLNLTPFPESPGVVNSPILGPGHRIFQLMFDLTCLSNYAPLKGADYRQALRHNVELTNQERALEVDGYPTGFALADSLVTFTLRIFLLKLLYPEIKTSNQHIRLLVSKAMKALGYCEGVNDTRISHACWPIFVLACAVEKRVDMEKLKSMLITIWKRSLCGQVRRWAIVIGRIWKARENSVSDGSGDDGSRDDNSDDGSGEDGSGGDGPGIDGLELLVQRESLLSNMPNWDDIVSGKWVAA